MPGISGTRVNRAPKLMTSQNELIPYSAALSKVSVERLDSFWTNCEPLLSSPLAEHTNLPDVKVGVFQFQPGYLPQPGSTADEDSS
jgi:hypothetical protein